jgi:hypothetical protein
MPVTAAAGLILGRLYTSEVVRHLMAVPAARINFTKVTKVSNRT